MGKHAKPVNERLSIVAVFISHKSVLQWFPLHWRRTIIPAHPVACLKLVVTLQKASF
jgi:hypothetical protein